LRGKRGDGRGEGRGEARGDARGDARVRREERACVIIYASVKILGYKRDTCS